MPSALKIAPFALGLALLASVQPASAVTCTSTATECSADLNIISNSNIGSGNQGTVDLQLLSSTQAQITVTLASGVEFVNSGGPHTAFVYNLSSSLTGVSYAFDSGTNTSPAGFAFASSSEDTPYGTFTNGVDYLGSNGGPPNSNPGPLIFTVTATGGLNLADFITNSGGYFFAADLYGTGGNTGAVAADSLSCVGDCRAGGPPPATTPLPSTLPLLVGGLGAFGLMVRRRKRKPSVKT